LNILKIITIKYLGFAFLFKTLTFETERIKC
jgi:hypothetical protein